MKKTSRFTLVELLVVIAVISILAGMLLPALAKAREVVKQTLCTSNTRQVTQGNYQYAADFDGFIAHESQLYPARYAIFRENGTSYIDRNYIGSSVDGVTRLLGYHDSKILQCSARQELEMNGTYYYIYDLSEPAKLAVKTTDESHYYNAAIAGYKNYPLGGSRFPANLVQSFSPSYKGVYYAYYMRGITTVTCARSVPYTATTVDGQKEEARKRIGDVPGYIMNTDLIFQVTAKTPNALHNSKKGLEKCVGILGFQDGAVASEPFRTRIMSNFGYGTAAPMAFLLRRENLDRPWR